jgi:DnaJ homolog subfamily C member 8
VFGFLPCIQAESDLSDAAKRAELDAIVSLARTDLLKALSLPATTPPSDPALKRLQPSWHVQVREKSKEMLIDEEVRRRKYVARLGLALMWRCSSVMRF